MLIVRTEATLQQGCADSEECDVKYLRVRVECWRTTRSRGNNTRQTCSNYLGNIWAATTEQQQQPKQTCNTDKFVNNSGLRLVPVAVAVTVAGVVAAIVSNKVFCCCRFAGPTPLASCAPLISSSSYFLWSLCPTVLWACVLVTLAVCQSKRHYCCCCCCWCSRCWFSCTSCVLFEQKLPIHTLVHPHTHLPQRALICITRAPPHSKMNMSSSSRREFLWLHTEVNWGAGPRGCWRISGRGQLGPDTLVC